MTEKQSEALLKVLSETQHRRHKLDVLKITFVAGLLGFSSIQIKDIMSFYQTLYFVPLVAMFFDLLIMGENFSIRRIGAFLRLYSGSKTEVSWQMFVSERRDKFFKMGSRGFTILSYIASIALLIQAKDNLILPEILWYMVILFGYGVLLYYGGKQLDDLDNLKTKNPIKEDSMIQ